jgi:hypothetical protein
LVVRDTQVPPPNFGEHIAHLPPDIESLYGEARSAMSGGAWTATVLVGRKLLMNVAATHGAAGDLKFFQYVDYLVDNGYITPNMRPWVDQIRQLGNEANHELPSTTRESAARMMGFVAMLLRIVFEYPARAHAIDTA